MANKQIKEYTDKPVPDDTDQILIQDALGVTYKIDLGNMHKKKVGYFDYNDSATASAPITHNGIEGFKKLTNNGLGPQTDVAHRPTSMSTMWNAISDQIDFSELSVGDMVDMRTAIEVTTTSPNQEVIIRIEVALGGTQFSVILGRAQFKTIGTYPMTYWMGGHIGSEDVRTNPAEIQVDTDSSATIEVIGWLFKVTRR